MPYTYRRLRGRIVEKFGTITKFAETLGTQVQAVSRKLNGKVPFTQKDISEWSQLLGIDKEDFGEFYFS